VQAAEDQQHTVAGAAKRLGATPLGALSRSLNAVVVHTDAAAVPRLAAIPGVRQVSAVPAYDVSWARDTPVQSGSLDQAIRYFDIDRAADQGFDGTGVRVAVVDSGIDYTHADLGGPGTAAAYTAAYGTSVNDPQNKNTDRLFPTAKVIGGFDFVGERWPGPDPACGVDSHGNPLVCLRPDPDPIDCG